MSSLKIDKKKLKIKLLGLTNPNDFFQMSKGSHYFQKRMNKYNKSNKPHVIFPDINSLISDYRAEKINNLTDKEVIKDEFGDEVRQFKEEQSLTNPSKLSSKNSNEIKKGINKTKENRKSLIVTLHKFENFGKILIPDNKKKELTSDLNPNKILFHKKTILEKRKRRKESLTDSFETFDNYDRDTKNSLYMLNYRINDMAKDVINDSENLHHKYSRNIKFFTNKFNDWKTIQEFRFPQLKKINEKEEIE
jgi:hypothetical protein